MEENIIALKPRELIIKTIKTERGEEEVVQIKGAVAFDPSFVNECKVKGVREYKDDTIIEVDE